MNGFWGTGKAGRKHSSVRRKEKTSLKKEVVPSERWDLGVESRWIEKKKEKGPGKKTRKSVEGIWVYCLQNVPKERGAQEGAQTTLEGKVYAQGGARGRHKKKTKFLHSSHRKEGPKRKKQRQPMVRPGKGTGSCIANLDRRELTKRGTPEGKWWKKKECIEIETGGRERSFTITGKKSTYPNRGRSLEKFWRKWEGTVQKGKCKRGGKLRDIGGKSRQKAQRRSRDKW